MRQANRNAAARGLAFALPLAGVILAADVRAEDPSHLENRHHVSVVIGGTYLPDADETAVTIGADYEYRVNALLGLGVVGERAVGEIDATTILAVADIHVWRGLVLQVGPGIEITDEETVAAGRLGGLYEFELGGGVTLSPQVHYDISKENAVVFGVALGRTF